MIVYDDNMGRCQIGLRTSGAGNTDTPGKESKAAASFSRGAPLIDVPIAVSTQFFPPLELTQAPAQASN